MSQPNRPPRATWKPRREPMLVASRKAPEPQKNTTAKTVMTTPRISGSHETPANTMPSVLLIAEVPLVLHDRLDHPGGQHLAEARHPPAPLPVLPVEDALLGAQGDEL